LEEEVEKFIMKMHSQEMIFRLLNRKFLLAGELLTWHYEVRSMASN